MSEKELRDIVTNHEVLPEDERRILDDVLSLRDRQISEVMRPRPEVVAVSSGGSVGEAIARIQELPFSRYPVVDQSLDDIVGFVHVRDLYDVASQGLNTPVTQVIRPIPFPPATARVLPTLTKLRAQNTRIAVVIDEYGGTDGIVTLEDLVEEVVGEIFDEYDTDTAPMKLAEDGGSVDGRLNLQDFAEATGIELPRGTWDTVAGFVLDRLGRLAQQGDTVEVDGVTLQVTGIDRRRIAEILVLPAATSPVDNETGMP